MIHRKVIYVLVFLVFIACSRAHRYGRTATSQVNKKYRTPIKINNSKSKAIFIDPKTVNTNVKHKKKIVGISSFYAEDFHGKLTANGEIYDM